jgi:hypothetical protein
MTGHVTDARARRSRLDGAIGARCGPARPPSAIGTALRGSHVALPARMDLDPVRAAPASAGRRDPVERSRSPAACAFAWAARASTRFWGWMCAACRSARCSICPSARACPPRSRQRLASARLALLLDVISPAPRCRPARAAETPSAPQIADPADDRCRPRAHPRALRHGRPSRADGRPADAPHRWCTTQMRKISPCDPDEPVSVRTARRCALAFLGHEEGQFQRLDALSAGRRRCGSGPTGPRRSPRARRRCIRSRPCRSSRNARRPGSCPRRVVDREELAHLAQHRSKGRVL